MSLHHDCRLAFRSALGCLIAGCLSLTTACGFEAPAPRAADGGGTLRFISEGAIDTLDPQGTSWLVDFRVIECLFEPLLRADPATGELQPAAAAALPKVSPDGRTYTFTLREDARWSTGAVLRSADFVYAWRRAIMPDMGADYSGLFLEIEGAEAFTAWRVDQLSRVAAGGLDGHAAWLEAKRHFADTVGLSTPDDRTLEVRLRRPVAYFNELAAFAAFMPLHADSAKAFESVDPASGTVSLKPGYFTDPRALVGNGPYKLTRWAFKQELVVDPNPHYWARDRVANARVVVQVVADPVTALLRYHNGEADWYPGVPTAAPQSAELVAAGRSGDRNDVHYGPAAGTYFYLFNCNPQVDGQPNPLADPRVRRALSMAVDRNVLVENVTRLNQPVARTFVPPGILDGYTPPVDAGIGFDPEGAKALLAEAGYPGGEGVSGLSVLVNSGGGHDIPALAIANMWRTHLGVDVSVEEVEKTAFRERRRGQAFTIARGGWYGDYRDPTTFLDMLRTADGNNDMKYAHPAYDALLQKAADELDPAARMALLADAEAMMLRDQPIMPLYGYTNLELFDPERLKGLHPNPWNVRRLDAVEVVEPADGGME